MIKSLSTKLICISIVIFVLFANTSTVFAQGELGQGISVDTFKPSSSIDSLFQLNLPTTKEHLKWTAGVLVNYAHHPVRRLVLNSENSNDYHYPLEMRIAADLSFAIGILDFLELGVVIPVVAYQTGEGSIPEESIQMAGVLDPRIEAKIILIKAGKFNGGIGATITAPLGHYISSGYDFMGTTSPSLEPKMLMSLDFGSLLLAFNAGFLIRSMNTMGDYHQNMAITWSMGAAYDLNDFEEPGGTRLIFENNAMIGIDFDSIAETPAEVLLGVKYRNKKDFIFSGGAGLGITDAVGTPLFRVFAGVYFDDVLRNCPAGPEDMDGFEDDDKCIDIDNDMDGLLDEEDECPNQSEDMDGFQDEDGCPDKDNDADGIPDTIDKCPMLAEDKDDFEDDDGCPEEGPGKPTVKITDTQLLLSSKVYFDFNKATIKIVSYPILDAVAEALNNNLHIKYLLIEGHTDNEGTEKYNQELSQERAQAVVDYLIGKSVDKERLTSVGLGFTKPIASNTSQEGRAINRRVEFTIIDKD